MPSFKEQNMYNIFQAIANYLSKMDNSFSLREKVAKGGSRPAEEAWPSYYSCLNVSAFIPFIPVSIVF
jgi:hypothetical protein